MEIRCVRCEEVFNKTFNAITEANCNNCKMIYQIGPDYIRYNFDELLFEKFKEKYLKNKVLNNNGYLGYLFLPEGSISLENRLDVKRFGVFLEKNHVSGKIIDIGCGIMELPGYLTSFKDYPEEIYGLDIISDLKFKWNKVIGCCEFLPFLDSSFSNVIFATSFDHLCDLKSSVKEVNRILEIGGRVHLWIGDNRRNKFFSFLSYCKYLLKRILKLTHSRKFTIYPNFTVLYTPSWAKDPFHSYKENPKMVKRIFEKNSFSLVCQEYNNKDEVFLTFKKIK